MAEEEDKPRLIERGFCLKQASIDSVHEKNVRHGHISTLHIWPARRPLAACRAALIATLLPDPSDPEKRKELLERIGGKVVSKPKKVKKGAKETVQYVEETEGGILHWGRENGPDMDYFREEIRKAYGGRAPRLLDPFAGGGAIPLEAMRLGCEATASDINPVAWFIEKCTLEYPEKLAGRRKPLPDFILENAEFMQEFYKAKGVKTTGRGKKQSSLTSFGNDGAISKQEEAPEADLAWHLRAWGWWVHNRVKNDLVDYYAARDDRATVGYLWARTVTCKNCRAEIPLLKTLWLCNKEKKSIRLILKPNLEKKSVEFSINDDSKDSPSARSGQKESSKDIGKGTMSSNGAWCPCCGKPGTIAMSKKDIQNDIAHQYSEGRPRFVMTAVIGESEEGKSYRLPTIEDICSYDNCAGALEETFMRIPFGIPNETVVNDAKGNCWATNYGASNWSNHFNSRQLLAMGTLVGLTREVAQLLNEEGYDETWVKAIHSLLALCTSTLQFRVAI